MRENKDLGLSGKSGEMTIVRERKTDITVEKWGNG